MKMFVSFLLFPSVYFLIGCTAMDIKNQSLHKEWKLVEMNHYQKEDFIQQNLSLNLGSMKENMVYSKCLKSKLVMNYNSDKITFKIKDQNLSIYSCSEMDREFVGSLLNAESYQINGHFLTLNLKGNKHLKFIAADWD